jgi:molybdenum cofactor cytidylyltransferase
MNIEGIILAAGFSERAGEYKMELRLGNKTLLERCIEGLATVCEHIIVVGGYQYEKIEAIVEHLPDIESVYNENFRVGMFSSVKRGIREIRAGRFFIIPGDQPLVKPETYRKLLSVDNDIVIPRFNGKKGHPVLFAGHLIPEILAIPDTAILRDFIHSKETFIVDVDDPGVGLDVDSPEDYEKIKVYFQEEML